MSAPNRMTVEDWAPLVGELATFCDRYLSLDEKAAMARRYADAVAGCHPTAVYRAIDRWYDQQPKQVEMGRKLSMPLPPAIRDMAREIEAEMRAKVAARSQPGRPAPSWAPPRREFVAAHLAAQRRIAALRVGALDRHDHRHGRGGCPVCGPTGDGFRSEIRQILDDLPEPRETLSKCPNHCRGGWLPGDVGVFPCPACLPDQHSAWLGAD